MAELRALLELRQAWPVAFAADGKTLLAVSDLPGTRQLFLLGEDGELVQLTDFREPVGGLLLPDGRILLETDAGGNERTQLHLLDAVPGAEPEPLVVDERFAHRTAHVSRDGTLLAYATNRRNGRDFDVVVRTLATGEERSFDLGGWGAVVSMSPDGRWVAACRRMERDLFLLDVESGEVVPAGELHASTDDVELAWAADASSFLAPRAADRDTLALARFDLASRSWRVELESDWDLRVIAEDAGRVVVETNEDGYSRLELRDLGTLALLEEIPLPARGVAEHVVFAPGGESMAFALSTTTEPHQTYLYELGSGGAPRRLTRTGAVEGGVEPSLHRVEAPDGESIPVFLFEPEGEGPFPVVVTVHGGPESQWRPWYSQGFGALTQFLVARGYAVAAPNVRGSRGYGLRFEHLDDRELRLDSVADLAAVHAWLVARPDLDGDRAVVYGRSYGGYMVLAALAFQPALWAAGIEMVGIANLRTFLEHTSEYRRAAREREYGYLSDPELLERLSPWSRLDAIRAPLFIEHGRNDPRVPVSESEAIHRALTERGVRCELVVYEDEGHLIERLENRIDVFERAAAFLDEVLT